jgi:hypothetical protein
MDEPIRKKGEVWCVIIGSILPIGFYSYMNTCSLPPGILFPKTLKMGQTSDPETLACTKK